MSIKESLPGQYFYKFDANKAMEWIQSRAQILIEKYDSFDFFLNSKSVSSKTEQELTLLSTCQFLLYISYLFRISQCMPYHVRLSK